jgi:cell division protein FtsI/penicillin-binding protein 2
MVRKHTVIHKILHFITHQSKEYWLLWVLGLLFFIILMRLFWLQVVTSFKYEDQLIKQHFTTQNIKADRGNIYVNDESGQPIQLTESIDLYTISIDPKFVKHKDKVIELLAPAIYQHYCSLHGTKAPDKLECIQ